MVQIKDYNRQILKLLKRDWPVFVIMSLLFLTGIWFGTQLLQTNPQLAEMIEKMVNRKFGGMKAWLKDTPFFMWIIVIWFNNIIASIMSFLSGIFLIGPALFVIYQGLIIGLVQKLTEAREVSAVKFYLSLSPHGIIELAAIFIVSGLGIRFGLILYRSLWLWLSGKDNGKLLSDFFTELHYYSVLITGMLLVAAIIESTISPALLKNG